MTSNNASKRLRIAFFGSGTFGLPVLKNLVAEHDVALVITQPDRPAGRKRRLTATPVGEFAERSGLPVIKPENPNEAQVIQKIHAVKADAFVVIAYGHKLSPSLLGDHFAINLHASLLPKFRGAAPINWAVISNEVQTGISVISLAQRMDAGAIMAQAATPVDPLETAGELHDRLAELGVSAVSTTLRDFQRGTLQPLDQDELLASRAPKLTKADGTVSFDQPSSLVRARIHGLTPWPGCTVSIGDQTVKLHRVKEEGDMPAEEPGTISAEGVITCEPGAVRILELQPPGSRVMSWQDYTRGHRLPANARCESR